MHWAHQKILANKNRNSVPILKNGLLKFLVGKEKANHILATFHITVSDCCVLSLVTGFFFPSHHKHQIYMVP